MKWLLLSACLSVYLSVPALAQDPRAQAGTPGMVEILGGEYVPLYGDRAQPVLVAPYQLDVYPVTNAEYLAFLQQHPQWQRANIAPLFADQAYLQYWQGNLALGEHAPGRAPVTSVSWFAAKAYCEAAGKRLPTLDEWEFAGRASQDDANAPGEDGFSKLILNWYGKPTRLPLANVGHSFSNVWGVWDMHGLVWEWVMDFNSIMMTGESRKDASGLDSQLFCAAGSIGSADPNDYAAFMRYAMRGSMKARYAVQNMGFRCARDVPDNPNGSSP